MHSSNFSAMYEPLKRSRVNLEDGRRLMTVEQWLAVDSGAAIGRSCTCRWLFLVGHDDSLLHANPALPFLQARVALRVPIVQ
jgi:hypothetical protein